MRKYCQKMGGIPVIYTGTLRNPSADIMTQPTQSSFVCEHLWLRTKSINSSTLILPKCYYIDGQFSGHAKENTDLTKTHMYSFRSVGMNIAEVEDLFRSFFSWFVCQQFLMVVSRVEMERMNVSVKQSSWSCYFKKKWWSIDPREYPSLSWKPKQNVCKVLWSCFICSE